MSVAVVGVDVGGTFTDFAVLRDGRLEVYKLPSTPSDPSRGILQGVSDLSVGEASYVHGSTVATNALLERRGARTALVTTHGFEDVLEIGRQNRPDLYDLGVDRPPALVPAELRFGVSERVDQAGAVVATPRPEELSKLVSTLDDAQVDAVAVVLLFSFLNPLHEELVAEALAGLKSNPYVSVSSQVVPEFREYERTSTVVVNSYVGPLMSRYISQLEAALGAGLRIMQSSGGSITAQLASNQPVRTILSGPAGGVVGAFHLASQAGYDDVITLDMGGTSTDVSLCPGVIKETTSSSLAGCPISVPMIEIHSVGAGGGSISRLDEGGALVVGPQSAGADPGPACYGVGDQVTVTDANLILGRLVPDQFLGGRLTLDRKRVEDLASGVAGQIGAGIQDAALGIIRVVNSNMERAIRTISLERGYDPREFTLIPFGGAGPMHCCDLAQELAIPRILVPARPGILSALGVAIADVVKDYSRTVMLRGGDVDRARLEEEFSGMEGLARQELSGEGLPVDQMEVRRFVDVRYVGQSFELTIDYPAAPRSGTTRRDLRQAIGESFYRAHLRRFGYADRNQPVEIVNLRLKLELEVEKLELTPADPGPSDPSSAQTGEAQVVFSQGVTTAALYQRDQLHCGHLIFGPALILQMDTTIVLPPGWNAEVDPLGNLLLELV
jgi:N-methylhydantoinase A/oxoprolinase/acetone carboxylase beta subunit